MRFGAITRKGTGLNRRRRGSNGSGAKGGKRSLMAGENRKRVGARQARRARATAKPPSWEAAEKRSVKGRRPSPRRRLRNAPPVLSPRALRRVAAQFAAKQ